METFSSTSSKDSQREEHKGDDCCRSKYSNALKHLLPFRPKSKNTEEIPGNTAGFFNYCSMHWLSSLMWKAFRKGLETKDIWKLSHLDGAEVNSARLERFWEEELRSAAEVSRKPRLWRCVFRFIRIRFLVALVISTITHILYFLGASVFIQLTLDYISDSKVNNQYAVILVIIIATTKLLVLTTLNNLRYAIGEITSIRVIGALQVFIYKKMLKLKTGGENLSAQVVNLMTNDMERIYGVMVYFVIDIMPPLMFILTAAYSLYYVGNWALMGQALYLLVYLIIGVLANIQSKIREETVKVTDCRVSLMNEILNSIKLIKMYSWEDAFAEKIRGIRKKELQKHQKGALVSAFATSMTPAISILATITTLLGYTLSGNELTSSCAFLVFSLFSNLEATVETLPYTVRSIVEARVAIHRIQKLLVMPEHNQLSGNTDDSSQALKLHHATFSWDIYYIDGQGNDNNSRCDSSKESTNIRDKSSKDGKVMDTLLNGYEATANDAGEFGDSKGKDVECSSFVKAIRTLFNIDLAVDHGKLIGVCGSIGSGKSSLISAICGDMRMQQGILQLHGRVAVVTQQPWIYNGSLRENILLGNPYNEDRYGQVLKSCCLESDLKLLPKGDLSEIGERGINLSGGQKQRVNLARAVYSDRDIYLLDDPLSAVDTQVAKEIFYKCITGDLCDKTVIFVTHATHFLEKCDEIILMKKGRIAEHGTHSELMASKGDYSNMVTSGAYVQEEDTKPTLKRGISHVSTTDDKNYGAESDSETADGKLISEEMKASGNIDASVYLKFIKVCGGYPALFISLLAVLAFTLSRIFSPVWLQIWMDQGDGKVEERRLNMTQYNLTYSDEELTGNVLLNPHVEMYQTVYGLSFFFLIGTGIIKGISITFSVLRGASRLHNDMFESILRSPMWFFDTTPNGRILNRFSRDLDEVDTTIPFFMETVLQGLLFATAQIVLVCYVYVWFIIPMVLIVGLFLVLDMLLKAGVRELKRIDSTLRSPFLQHIVSTISGLSVIRTFDKQQVFTERMYQLLDTHSAASLLFNMSSKWYMYRADILGCCISVSITAICVFTKGIVSTATAGLALTASMMMCEYIPWLMTVKSDLQASLTSVERLTEYAYELKSEAPREIPSTKPSSDWPSAGALELKGVKLRYRPELPLVLHGISASIKPGEKVGIVGRTGAGKSSLMTALLRLTEMDCGQVTIDDVDISTLGLHSLRSAISVIPQDPVLFQGSVRYNLDPFDKHSDDKVWQALEQSHLKGIVQEQELGLASQVDTGGENFSVGERQLICLTRALLRNSKILLLDEATASVDIETDQLIQRTIREAFMDSTVITIAHRLNTIATYDRVMVLEAGKIMEFDAPESLMQMEGSKFRDMMAAMGVTSVEQMKRLT